MSCIKGRVKESIRMQRTSWELKCKVVTANKHTEISKTHLYQHKVKI